ncbi:MAG: FtsX-like permease family protein [Pirellulales bacterium]
MRLTRYSLRELRLRPGRTLLTLLGIAFGVAAVLAIALVIDTTRRAYREMHETIAGRAALEIVAEGLGGFQPRMLETLRTLPGVERVVPVVQAHTALASTKGVVGLVLMGIDPAQDKFSRHYAFHAGRQVAAGDEVVLEAGFARSHGLALAQPVRLLTASGTATLTLVGLLAPEGPAGIVGGHIAFVPIETAQRLLNIPGEVNSLELVLADGANSVQVADTARRTLPAGLLVQEPATRGSLSAHSMLSTEQALAAMSAVSLVAGAFVILNTFLMSLGERQRQLAILRALGATRRQITRMLLGEAAVLGIVGTALGMVLGVVAAAGMTRAMERLQGTPLPSWRFVTGPFLLAALIGPGMAIAATYVPARLAARRNLLTGLFEELRGAEPPVRRWPSLLGLVIVLADAALLVPILSRWLPSSTITALLPVCMAGFLVGAMLLMPMLIGPLLTLVAPAVRPLLGIEGQLALGQLRRRPTRTSLTVGVLFIAMVVTIAMGTSLLNNIRDIGRWTARTITADYLVRSVMPDTGVLAAAAMPERLTEELGALDGVRRVDKLNFVPVRVGGEHVLLLARSHDPDRPLAFDLVEGDADALRGQLAAGHAAIGTMMAQRMKLAPGSTFELDTRDGPLTVRVAAVVSEYTVGGMAFYMERDAARRLLNFRGVDVYMVAARDGQAKVIGTRLARFCDEQHLLLQSQQDFRDWINRMMAGVLASMWLLMALVFVVASLGVVNTLTMNALERTRDFGVLRAVGMIRRQVRKMVFGQAVTLAMASVLPGVAVGCALAWLMNASTKAILGRQVPFAIDVPFVVGCAAAAVVVSLAAAALPARRMSRQPLVQALKYE